MKKICIVCKKEFEKLPEHSQKYWKTKKYCSQKCYGIDKLGFRQSDETIRKIKKNHLHLKGDKHPCYGLTGEKSGNWKGGMVKLICKFCSKEFKVKPYRKYIAKYCSRKCATDDNLGLTSINERERKSKKYKNWRNIIFKRDNYTCQKCGIRNKKRLGKTIILHADHIKSFAYFPELRFEVSNGRTLCERCHKETDTFGVSMWRNFNKNFVAFLDNI